MMIQQGDLVALTGALFALIVIAGLLWDAEKKEKKKMSEDAHTPDTYYYCSCCKISHGDLYTKDSCKCGNDFCRACRLCVGCCKCTAEIRMYFCNLAGYENAIVSHNSQASKVQEITLEDLAFLADLKISWME